MAKHSKASVTLLEIRGVSKMSRWGKAEAPEHALIWAAAEIRITREEK